MLRWLPEPRQPDRGIDQQSPGANDRVLPFELEHVVGHDDRVVEVVKEIAQTSLGYRRGHPAEEFGDRSEQDVIEALIEGKNRPIGFFEGIGEARAVLEVEVIVEERIAPVPEHGVY